MTRKYSLLYNFEVEAKKKGFTKAEADHRGGGCDALVFVSILRDGNEPHQGPKSIAIVSRDGFLEGDPNVQDLSIPKTELFQVMRYIAHHLARAPASNDPRKQVPLWQRAVCQQVLTTTRAALETFRGRKQMGVAVDTVWQQRADPEIAVKVTELAEGPPTEVVFIVEGTGLEGARPISDFLAHYTPVGEPSDGRCGFRHENIAELYGVTPVPLESLPQVCNCGQAITYAEEVMFWPAPLQVLGESAVMFSGVRVHKVSGSVVEPGHEHGRGPDAGSGAGGAPPADGG